MNRRACPRSCIPILSPPTFLSFSCFPQCTYCIFPVDPQLWHILDKDHLEISRNLQIIRTAQWLSTKFLEGESGHRGRALGDVEFPAPYGQFARVYHWVRVGVWVGVRSRGEGRGWGCLRGEEFRHFRPDFLVQRVEVDFGKRFR